MFTMREVNLQKSLAAGVLALIALAGSSQRARMIPGVVLGPPMTVLAMRGSYLEALRIAYDDWRRRMPKAHIEDQKITVTREQGLIYVWFIPRPGPGGPFPGCATPHGVEVLYVIDEQKRKIVRRDIPC